MFRTAAGSFLRASQASRCVNLVGGVRVMPRMRCLRNVNAFRSLATALTTVVTPAPVRRHFHSDWLDDPDTMTMMLTDCQTFDAWQRAGKIFEAPPKCLMSDVLREYGFNCRCQSLSD